MSEATRTPEGLQEFRSLIARRADYDPAVLERAWEVAQEAHRGQRRKTGDPYIIHPLQVATTLARWGLDNPTVAAGLLHDVVEDTAVDQEDVTKEFGSPIAELVYGVTKLGEIDLVTREQRYEENLRKMFLAMAKDIRVLMIKLADRLHNMQTLGALPAADRIRISRETLDVYAPLANRLGMGELKAELEDLAFRHLDPERFRRIGREVQPVLKGRERYITIMKRLIGDRLQASGIETQIEGRTKHLYSIAKKYEKAGDLDKIYDLVAIRVIVGSVEECYQALGVIHEEFKPLIYRIKDYIAVPKPNGYRSLHTTVFGHGGMITEIQIRTAEMHEEAERGLAAHFHYDETKSGKEYRRGQTVEAPESRLAWVTSLMDWQQEMASGEEFIEGLRLDVFEDRIFVFTPKGDVYDLPEGATPVDFAYHVHSRVGDSCVGAKVNGRIVPLERRLENRDIVEILTAKTGHPSQDWLSFVKTGQARSRIRAYFRSQSRERHHELGKELIDKEHARLGQERLDKLTKARQSELLDRLHQKSLEDVYVALGEGSLTAGAVLRQLFTPEELGVDPAPKKRRPARRREGSILVAGQSGLLVHLRSCCTPSPGDPIVGVVTKSQGISVHRVGCRSLGSVSEERKIPVSWESTASLAARIQVTCEDRIGMLRDLTAAISDAGVGIRSVASSPADSDGLSQLDFDIEIENFARLREVLIRLEQVGGVVRARRLPA